VQRHLLHLPPPLLAVVVRLPGLRRYPVIDVTGEMLQAWQVAFNQAAADAVRTDAPFQTGDIARAGLAAVLALVERDYVVARRVDLTVVHLLSADEGLTLCCRRNPFELPRDDRVSINQHAVTCKGPS
jgi:hypothetical protein